MVFLLFALAVKLDIYNLSYNSMTNFIIFILYITSLFIIAGIDKENINIQRSVLLYAFVVAVCYMTYVCIQNYDAIYTYIIYMIITIMLLSADIIYCKYKQKQSYIIGCLMLILYMLVFSESRIMYLTIMTSIVLLGTSMLFTLINKKKKIHHNENEILKKPIGFYLCISNIALIILSNFLIN